MCAWAPKFYYQLNESTEFAYNLEKTTDRQDFMPYLSKSVKKRWPVAAAKVILN